MKVNKMGKTNVTWKVKFWVMPVLYFMAWGVNAYVLASPQAMTIGITLFLFMNLFVFCLLFKSQFNRVKDSIVNVLFIESVVSRKVNKSFFVWIPLISTGAYLGGLSFIVISTIAMWLSAFVFILSNPNDLNIISPGSIYVVNKSASMEYYDEKYGNYLPYVGMVNPATGLPLVSGPYDSSGSFYGTSNINNN